MLTGVDKQTGERLPDDNIRAQCITFLIAGHETTVGSAVVRDLLPDEEPGVRSSGRGPRWTQVLGNDGAARRSSRCTGCAYVRQVLDETLRLWPTAPPFTRYPYEDTVIGGRYAIPADTVLTVLTPDAAPGPRSSGATTPRSSTPTTSAAERLAALPPNAYTPFGTGLRACIGRQFALQEATLVLGMLVQRFEFIDHRDYQLHTQATLTVKPDDFCIQVRPRAGRAHRSHRSPAHEAERGHPRPAHASRRPPVARHGTPLSVLFGSNLGTAEGIANRLAQEGTERGYEVTVGALDDHGDDLPTGGRGADRLRLLQREPPDNAAAFCRLDRRRAAGRRPRRVLHRVRLRQHRLGRTYQAVPTLLDEQLAAHGGQRIHPRGEGNAAGDFDADYRAWHGDLWTDVASALDLPTEAAAPAPAGPRLSITLTNRQVTNPVIASYAARPALVRATAS